MVNIKDIKQKGIAILFVAIVSSVFGCGSAEKNDIDSILEAYSPFYSQVATESELEQKTTESLELVTDEETTTSDKTTAQITTAEKEITTEEKTTTVKITTTEKTTIKETTTKTKETTTRQETTTKTKETTTGQETTTIKETTTLKPTTTAKETTTQPVTTTTTTISVSTAEGVFKEFGVTTLDGQNLTQDVFSKADVNVVIIWTTWCGYCKLEMPALQKVMEKYAGESVQFFSLVCDVGTYASEDDATYLINQMGVTFPCMIYNESMSDGYMESIDGYPKTLYLNREGKIMYEVGGAYAGYGEDYAVECHSHYMDYFIANPDYLP